MPDNKELKKNQEEAKTLVDSRYTVTLEGGGTTCEEKPILEALLPGVRLHFLRYGFFQRTSKTDAGFNISGSIDGGTYSVAEMDASNGGVSPTDTFYVAKTSPRKGFIYLINEENLNDHHELLVNDDGLITPVLWKEDNIKEDGRTPEDFRKTKEKVIRYKRVLNKEKDNPKKYWIGYSPVQWSYEYHKKMMNSSVDEKKQAHLILVSCGGIKNGEEDAQEHVSTYRDVKLVHYKDHPNKEKIKKTIWQINRQEKSENNSSTGNSVYEDMFISLHDPLGCAEDIAHLLGEKIIDFKGLVEAIQTGHGLEKAKTEVAKGNTLEPINKEFEDLYNLALTTYKMVYSSDEAITQFDGGDIGFNFNDSHFPNQAKPEGYSSRRGRRYKYPPGHKFNEVYIGNGVDRVKVEGILGVQIRKQKRETLNVFRKEYWDFIQTRYLKDALCHYVNNSPEFCVYGKEQIHRHLLLVYNNPYNYDRHLLHIQDYKETDDIIKGIDAYLEKEDLTNADDNLERIILEKITLNKDILSQVVDVSNKFAGAIASKLELYSSEAFKAKLIVSATTGKPLYQKIIQQRNTFILKKINRIQVSTVVGGTPQDVFFVGGNTSNISVKAELLGLDPNVEVHITNADGSTQSFVGESVEHKPLNGKQSRAKGGSNQLQIGDKVKDVSEYEYRKNELNGKRYNQKAAKFFNSRGFNGVLFGLQVINIANSVNGLVETLGNEKSSDGQKIKSFVGTVGVSVDLANAYGTLRQAHLRATAQNVTRGLASRTAFVGALGGVLTSGMCFWDASVAFGKRDTDSGVAWALAGIAFGAATTAGIIGGLAAASAAGTLTAAGTVAVGVVGAEAIGAIALMTNPIGWVCLGIGVGLVIAAYVLSDNELEFYFKHFLLNDRVKWEVKSNQLPMAYTQSILDNKELLMDTDDSEIINSLMEPADAIATLFDHTIANAITFHAPFEFKSKWHGSGRSARRKVYGYNVSFVIKRFLSDPCQVKVRAVLINGTDEGSQEFDITINNDTIKETEQGPQFSASFIIPPNIRDKVGKYTKLVLAIKIALKGDEGTSFFPYPLQNKKDRYMGTCIRLYEGRGPNQRGSSEQEIVYDSFNELVKKWK